MDIDKLRRSIIAAVVSEDELLKRLVLKGGNALLLHEVTDRASLDFDFSTSDEELSVEFLEANLVPALERRLAAERDLVVFGAEVRRKPKKPDRPEWGGFLVTFRLISRAKCDELGGDENGMKRMSLDVDGTGQGKREFRIEISPGEFTEGKVEKEVDGQTCYLYSLRMILAEKLRAICQQMDGYEFQKTPSPRPRDFYDIHSVHVVEKVRFDDVEFRELVRAVFEAKSVPLKLLREIGSAEVRAFHETGWPQVLDSLRDRKRALDYDFYHAYVVGQVESLEPLWVV